MNPVALYFASGESLYAGVAILMLAIVLSPLLERQWMLQLQSVVAWLALALVVMACPPFAWIVDAIFLSLFATWFILSKNRTAGKTLVAVRIGAGVILFMLTLVLSLLEFSRRTMPVITGVPSDHLVVIGDSISSGIDSRVSSWPVVMQESTGVPVKNLARPGAQATDGMAMASQVKPEDRVVIVEIGGNDLLLGTPSKEFAQGLDATLSELAAPGRTVVMFELPLLPHKIAYGQIQRRLATKYGVFLWSVEQPQLRTDCIFLILVRGAWPTSWPKLFRTFWSCTAHFRRRSSFAQCLRPSIKSKVCCLY
jgi:acyl-CoA thioesterase I